MAKLQKEYSESCREQCEFVLRLIIDKLKLCDKNKSQGFKDISVVLTLDSNVIKIENIQSENENVNQQRIIYFTTTPEQFSKKLKHSPMLVNLSRGCDDLGTVKIKFPDCSCEAILSGDFENETIRSENKFVNDGIENALMEMSLDISKQPVSSDAMKDFLRANAKRLERKRAPKSTCDVYESTASSSSECICDAELLRELCQSDITDKAMSTKSKESKCVSDIAASLDVNIFSDDQKTFCLGCRGYSVSGVTCMNKKVLKDGSSTGSPNDDCTVSTEPGRQKKCQPVNRICSECFANLSVLPRNMPCPNCSCLSKMFELEKDQKRDKKTCGNSSPSYFQKMLKEILCEGEKEADMTRKKSTKRVAKNKTKKECKTQKPKMGHSVYLNR